MLHITIAIFSGCKHPKSKHTKLGSYVAEGHTKLQRELLLLEAVACFEQDGSHARSKPRLEAVVTNSAEVT